MYQTKGESHLFKVDNILLEGRSEYQDVLVFEVQKLVVHLLERKLIA